MLFVSVVVAAYWMVGSVAVIVPLPNAPLPVERIVAPLTLIALVSPVPPNTSSPPLPCAPPMPALIWVSPALPVPVSVQVPPSCLVSVPLIAAPVSAKVPGRAGRPAIAGTAQHQRVVAARAEVDRADARRRDRAGIL